LAFFAAIVAANAAFAERITCPAQDGAPTKAEWQKRGEWHKRYYGRLKQVYLFKGLEDSHASTTITCVRTFGSYEISFDRSCKIVRGNGTINFYSQKGAVDCELPNSTYDNETSCAVECN